MSQASPADDKRLMRLAIETARRGVNAGQTPFGACIARQGEIIACSHNQVWLDTDITAHAEVCCIRRACQTLRTIDLSGCVIYSTTEPCPMCFGAIHWARIDRIVFGAGISNAKTFGFSELEISNKQMKQSSGSPVTVESGLMRDQAVELFRDWQSRTDTQPY